MRAVVSNAMSKSNASPQEKEAVFRSLEKASGTYNRHFGYQPLQRVLDELFDDPRFFAHYLGKSPEQAKPQVDKLKRQIYSTATAPVLSKLIANFAMMSAIPGQPSIHYATGAAGQGGADYLMKKFLQNLGFFPSHWMEELNEGKLPKYFEKFAAQFKDYQKQLTEVVQLKSRFPPMNDGFMLPIFHFDGYNKPDSPYRDFLNQEGVFIMPRTNGEETTIALVNDLQATKASWDNNSGYGQPRIGTDKDYNEIAITRPKVSNFNLDVASLHGPDGEKITWMPDGAQFVSYRNNNPDEGVEKTYTVRGGKIPGSPSIPSKF